jgi:hypothetical protein
MPPKGRPKRDAPPAGQRALRHAHGTAAERLRRLESSCAALREAFRALIAGPHAAEIAPSDAPLSAPVSGPLLGPALPPTDDVPMSDVGDVSSSSAPPLSAAHSHLRRTGDDDPEGSRALVAGARSR